MKSLKQVTQYFDLIPKDAAAEIQARTVQEVLNDGGGDQWVGVISGNLRRAQRIKSAGAFKMAMFSDLSIAPYARDVNDRLAETGGFKGKRESNGRGYLKIAMHFYSEPMRKAAIAEWSRLIEIVNNRGNYKYRNPFGSIGAKT